MDNKTEGEHSNDLGIDSVVTELTGGPASKGTAAGETTEIVTGAETTTASALASTARSQLQGRAYRGSLPRLDCRTSSIT